MTKEQELELKELEAEIENGNKKRFENEIENIEREIESYQIAKLEVKNMDNNQFLTGIRNKDFALLFEIDGKFKGFGYGRDASFHLHNNLINSKLDFLNIFNFKIEKLKSKLVELNKISDDEKIKFGIEMSKLSSWDNLY